MSSNGVDIFTGQSNTTASAFYFKRWLDYTNLFSLIVTKPTLCINPRPNILKEATITQQEQ